MEMAYEGGNPRVRHCLVQVSFLFLLWNKSGLRSCGCRQTQGMGNLRFVQTAVCKLKSLGWGDAQSEGTGHASIGP